MALGAMEQTKETVELEKQLYQLTTLVAGNTSLQQALDRLAEAAVRIVGVKACSIRLLDENAGDLKMCSTFGLSQEYRNKGVVSKDDPVIKAAFLGEAVILDDMRVDDRVKYKEASIKEGIVSQLTVAMVFRDKAIGVLRLYSPEPKRFTRENISLARSVASQCATAITNAKLYAEAMKGAMMAEQLKLAGVIQRRMIPEQAPVMDRLDISAAYIPCFDVGGDFYDFIQIDNDHIAIIIADVIGKGLPAAIMMSSFRGSARAYIDGSKGKNLLEIINRINKYTCKECENGEFITMFSAIINVKKMTMTYCNCGHEPAILVRKNKCSDLNKGGLVLGVEEDFNYECGTVKLVANDCILFYTDGLIDAVNFDGQLWTRENLQKAAIQFTDGAARHIVKNILSYRRRFVGLAKQVDDTSLIAIKING